MTTGIVVVEDRAHEREGHYPLVFATLATTLREMGFHVTALTARGWALRRSDIESSFEQARFGWFHQSLLDLAAKLERRSRQRIALFARDLSRSAAILSASRREARGVGASTVMSVSRNLHPVFAALLGGRLNWAVFRFDEPSGWMESKPARPLLELARRAT